MSANLKWKLVTTSIWSCVISILVIGIVGCQQPTAIAPSEPQTVTKDLSTTSGPIAEVNIPASINQLAPALAKFQPQVKIISPQPEQISTDDRVSVKLQVRDLPLFKHPKLGLGNHIHVVLDRQAAIEVEDITQPLVFEQLTAGTHTIRAFASRPWHESFKNPEAYAQTTFHVLTPTASDRPDSQQPLLTYNSPSGIYGAEPILLDYYVTNVPERQATDWRVRATINNQSFTIDRWEPIYLHGFKQGKNWVKLELINDRGEPIPNIYNEEIAIVTYDPQVNDGLTKLIKGELDTDLMRSLVDPSYVAVVPTPTPTTEPIAEIDTKVEPTAIAQRETTVTPQSSVDSHPATVVTPLPQPSINPHPTGSSPMPIIISPVPVEVILPHSANANTVITPPSLQPTAAAPIVAQPESRPKSGAIVPAPDPADIITPAAQAVTPSPNLTPPPKSAQPIVVVPSESPHSVASGFPPLQPSETSDRSISSNIPTETPAPLPSAIAPVIISPNPVLVISPTPKPPQAPVAKAPNLPITPQPIVKLPINPSPQVPQPPVERQPIPNSTPVTVPQPPVTLQPVTIATPQVSLAEKTWKQEAIELVEFIRLKIKAFTNTIPSKVQQLSHQIQVWSSQAIENVRSWSNRD